MDTIRVRPCPGLVAGLLAALSVASAAVPEDVPRRLSTPPPQGAVEMARFGRVAGWVLAGNPSASAPQVRIQLDEGAFVPILASETGRVLLKREEFDEIPCGFDVDLLKKAGITNERLKRVRLRVWAVDPSLPASQGEVLLHDREVDLSVPPPAAQTLRPKIIVCILDPRLTSEGDRPLTQVMGWKDPRRLTEDLIARIKELSGGAVEYQPDFYDIPIVFPSMDTPEKEARFVELCHRYRTLLDDWKKGLVEPEKVREFEADATREIDALSSEELACIFSVALAKLEDDSCEAWVWRMPFTKAPKAMMFGPGKYSVGWGSYVFGPHAERRSVVMCFDYQQTVDDCLHAYAHRCQGVLEHGLRPETYAGFGTYDRKKPGAGGCGTVHCPPNSEILDPEATHRSSQLTPSADYDVAGLEFVDFDPSKWGEGQGTGPRRVNRDEWGGPAYFANHLAWYFHQIPRGGGSAGNWWRFIVDPNSPPP